MQIKSTEFYPYTHAFATCKVHSGYAIELNHASFVFDTKKGVYTISCGTTQLKYNFSKFSKFMDLQLVLPVSWALCIAS
jgi:hypothetical protein